MRKKKWPQGEKLSRVEKHVRSNNEESPQRDDLGLSLWDGDRKLCLQETKVPWLTNPTKLLHTGRGGSSSGNAGGAPMFRRAVRRRPGAEISHGQGAESQQGLVRVRHGLSHLSGCTGLSLVLPAYQHLGEATGLPRVPGPPRARVDVSPCSITKLGKAEA